MLCLAGQLGQTRLPPAPRSPGHPPAVQVHLYLTEAEFRDGLQQLEHDALAGPPSRPAPVNERYDVLVLTNAWH